MSFKIYFMMLAIIYLGLAALYSNTKQVISPDGSYGGSNSYIRCLRFRSTVAPPTIFRTSTAFPLSHAPSASAPPLLSAFQRVTAPPLSLSFSPAFPVTCPASRPRYRCGSTTRPYNSSLRRRLRPRHPPLLSHLAVPLSSH
jgi:hypothetical protein